ncbi:MAG: ubiquinone biosynthesis protein [Betaproteobacteria bacterium]|nr:ubiquinone biosynthesis protein [Betaproteobacteria bacterium]
MNHLLESASWARERLKPFAGKTARFNLAPFAVTLAIRASGEVDDSIANNPRDTLAERPVAGTGAEARYPQTAGCASNESARPPDASFTLTPGEVLRMLAADESAWRDVQVNGDTALAREILAIAQNLRWDVEEDLSRVFGDIAAHRMVQAGNDFVRWQHQSAENLARSAAAYWTEERPLIATRQDVERFVREVDALRDDVARIEQRIDRFAARGERR